METAKIPLSEKVLAQRINRKLRKVGEVLKHTRGTGSVWLTLGEYYVVDIYGNYVTQYHVDVEELGRDLGVIQPYEIVSAEA